MFLGSTVNLDVNSWLFRTIFTFFRYNELYISE